MWDELSYPCRLESGPERTEKWCAPDFGPALEDPQAHIEFAGFDPLQDRSEMCIEQADMQIGSLTPELPDGLRQDVGRDHGRRSDRQSRPWICLQIFFYYEACKIFIYISLYKEHE